MASAPIAFEAAAPETLRVDPENRTLLDGMRECAEGTDAPDLLPWRVGRHNVTTHPDLVEWTAELAAAVERARLLFVCGRPMILAADDRILGFGRGTLDFVIRATAGTRSEITVHGGHPDERYGGNWLVFPAFLPNVPRPQQAALIARWLKAARDA